MAETKSLEETVLKIRLLVDKEKNKVVLAEVRKDFVDVLFRFLAMPMGTIVRLLENQKSQTTKIGCFNNLYGSVRNMGTNDFFTEACRDALLMDVRSNGIVRKSELFISNRNLFIVTDNMEVEPASVSLTFKTIKGLGYADADTLEEILVDVNHEKILALLECLFSSDTPLTDVFLRNRSSYVMTRTHNIPSLAMQEEGSQESNELFSVTLFIRKQDKKVIYVESKNDFVDLFFSFLVVPLECVWELSGINIVLGCVGNFCKSMKELSKKTYTDGHHSLRPSYPNGSDSRERFVKRGQNYMILDDLTITPVTSPTFSMEKKLEVGLDDIEEHAIVISRAEDVRLLIASLMTSTALTTALGCLIP